MLKPLSVIFFIATLAVRAGSELLPQAEAGDKHETIKPDYGTCPSHERVRVRLPRDITREKKNNTCGLTASWIMQTDTYGSVLYREWVDTQPAFGVTGPRVTTEGDLKKMLNRARKKAGKPGIWKSQDYPPGGPYIHALKRHTRGDKVAAVITNPGYEQRWNTLHWYVVTRVQGRWGDEDCTVYVKDAKGCGTYTCRTMVEIANYRRFFSELLVTPNDIVYLELAPPRSSTWSAGNRGSGGGGGLKKLTHLAYQYLIHLFYELFDPSF